MFKKSVCRFCAFASVSVLMLQGCSSINDLAYPERNPQKYSQESRSKLAKYLEADAKTKESIYRARAAEFVEAAVNGKVDEMMQMTSPITLRNVGTGVMRTNYMVCVVPAFERAAVSWKPKAQLIRDETYNVGWKISGVAEGKTKFPFHLDVMKEGETLVIMNIGNVPRPNPQP